MYGQTCIRNNLLCISGMIQEYIYVIFVQAALFESSQRCLLTIFVGAEHGSKVV